MHRRTTKHYKLSKEWRQRCSFWKGKDQRIPYNMNIWTRNRSKQANKRIVPQKGAKQPAGKASEKSSLSTTILCRTKNSITR